MDKKNIIIEVKKAEEYIDEIKKELQKDKYSDNYKRCCTMKCKDCGKEITEKEAGTLCICNHCFAMRENRRIETMELYHYDIASYQRC